jgi:hypothetical protein
MVLNQTQDNPNDVVAKAKGIVEEHIHTRPKPYVKWKNLASKE